ncbi:TetR/AcrR family transcriptional regulator [Kutzneria sp. CA-103260]|uniref:TetR/AcrR family transcriptional regulator n=1 Tax=Kutzneria sp. CA-103260 TaxID=2802641 RepID=UPI001BA9C260|nr:TetR/AcrR family transcriptional regulator [Kutzneria sp. CA-103260]QUQ63523.1 TetR family transcriptional regulator [Kutzneria sp. CA-103260]
MDTGVSQIRPLRSDAEHNRERIVAAAGELFASRGLDVQMATVARLAGVGTATLYRRFPTKESLVAEVFADKFENCTRVIEEALADPDPWRGLCTVLAKVAELQATDRGFSAAFLAAFPDLLDFGDCRDRGLHVVADLIDRAKRSGQLRADFAVSDLALVMTAVNGIAAAVPAAAPAASRRLVAYLLTSFRAEHAGPLPPPAPIDLGDLVPGWS